MNFDSAETLRLAQFLLDRQTHLGPYRAATWEKEAWDDYRAASQRLKLMQERIAELEAEATTFAKQAASEKLRADQMTEQHRMQAKMHKAAAEALGKVLSAVQRYLPPDGPSDGETLNEIIGIVDPWPIPLDSSEPKPSSTPWYPDDSGEWVEGNPIDLPADTMLAEWMYEIERDERRYKRPICPRQVCVLPFNVGPLRIVAYKVVKP